MTDFTTQMEEPELDVKGLLKVLLRRQKTVVGFTVFFLAVSVCYAMFWPKTYQSVTTVKVPDSSQSTANALREIAFLPTSGDPIETFMQIGEADKVAVGAIDILGLRNRPELRGVTDQKLIFNIKKQIKLDNLKRSNLVSIAARAKNPQDAADLANAWAKSFIQTSLELSREAEEGHYQFIHGQLQAIKEKLSRELENKKNFLNQSNEAEADEQTYKSFLAQDQEAKIRSNVEVTGIVVVDSGSVPDKPVSPKKVTAVVLGTAAGLFLGILTAFGRERLKDLVHEESDLSRVTGLPVWAVIPWASADRTQGPPDPDLLLSQPALRNSPFHQSFKTLRTNLILARLESGPLALGIFSPGRYEGRTLVGANLALALAQAGEKVLLVDADPENPMVGTLFGVELPGVSGLSRLLTGQAKVHEVEKSTSNPNLTILPSPAITTDPVERLGTGTMKKLVGDLKKQFDFIIFDMPPLLDSADSVVLSTAMDGAVLLALYGSTNRTDILKARRQLQSARTTVWGAVPERLRPLTKNE